MVGQRWAGPSHWKFGRVAKPTGSSQTKRVPTSKGAKAPFVIDFSKNHEVLAALEASVAGVSKASARRATTLSDAALAKAATQTHTLPEDCHVDIEVLSTYFQKPKERVQPLRHVKKQMVPGGGDGGGDGGGEAPFDDEGGAPFDADDDMPDNLHDQGYDDEGGQLVPADSDLVAAPTRCEKIQVRREERKKMGA